MYIITVTVDDRNDAGAIAELIAELGFESTISRKRSDDCIKTPPSQTRLGRAILNHMCNSRTYEAEDFEAPLLALGYKPASISPMLSGLTNEGTIRRIGRGLYQKILPTA